MRLWDSAEGNVSHEVCLMMLTTGLKIYLTSDAYTMSEVLSALADIVPVMLFVRMSIFYCWMDDSVNLNMCT